MPYVEHASSKSRASLQRILRSAPKWFCESVDRERRSQNLDPLNVTGLPNDQGSPEQLLATEHALLLRKVELLLNEAERLKSN